MSGQRLIYCADSSIPSRASNSIQVMRMCDAFAGQGIDVTLVHPNIRAELPEGFGGDVAEFYGVRNAFERRTLRVPQGPLVERSASLSRIGRLAVLGGYLLRRSRPGAPPFACYARSPIAAWAAIQARRAWGRRAACRAVLLELHDDPPHDFVWRVLEDVDGVVAISDALRARILERSGGITDRVWVEHDGVDLESVDRRKLDRTEARERLGIEAPEGPLVVYTGRANRNKGVDVVLAAARQLQDLGAQFLIVGKVYDPTFEREASRNVRFTGFVPPASVPDYLAAADLLVMPSTADMPYAAYTSPLKLFEYMASGRPVVASDLPVLAEVLRHERNALLYSARDPGALARAVDRLWVDRDLAVRLAEQAHRDVQHFSWDRRAHRIMDRIGLIAVPNQSSVSR